MKIFETNELVILLMAMLLLGFTLLGIVMYVHSESVNDPYGTDLDLGSMVTTTAVYEYVSNDSFSGVVVRGETSDDPALTVRNRDGTERRIATEFLKPME